MASTPTPRIRVRRSLYDFATSCKSGLRPLQGWMDHLRFALPKIGLSRPCDPDELLKYLQQRKSGRHQLFEIERPSNRRVKLTFRQSKWLFNLQISITYVDGQWTGSGDLSLNPTRFLRSAGLIHGWLHGETFNPIHLLRVAERTPLPDTLDGNDNYVPDALIPDLLRADWPHSVQAYASAVLETVTDLLGTLHDYDLSDPRHIPLFRLPVLYDWTLRYAEVYVEFREPEALLQTAAIAEHARSLASIFTVENHGRAPTTSDTRSHNMPAVLFNLGAEGVQLSVYAKTFERLRLEVRFKKYPMRQCRLSRSSYPKSPDFIRDVLRDVQANAMRRATKFLQGYDRSRGSSAPHLLSLVSLLSTVSRACGDDLSLMNRVLSLLILNNGMSRTADESLQAIAQSLIESDVLRQVRTTLRASTADYAVAPRYASTLRALRSLENL